MVDREYISKRLHEKFAEKLIEGNSIDMSANVFSLRLATKTNKFTLEDEHVLSFEKVKHKGHKHTVTFTEEFKEKIKQSNKTYIHVN